MLAKLAFCLVVLVVCVLMASQKIQQEPDLEILLEKSSKYVGATYPHGLGYNGNNIKVAVIDTGVDYTHPDLFGFGPNGKVIGGFDFIENDDSPLDTNGHGTEVAGIIAADGKVQGIAPGAKILAYRVSDTGESVSSDLIVKAIERAVQDGAEIINISLGVNRTNDKIEDAINHAVSKGIVVVAAAGNSGPDPKTIGSPGKDPHAITVGATYNNLTASLVATLQIDGKRLEVLPMVGTEPLSQPIESQIVFGKYGREGDLKDIDAAGKILLIERGSDKKDELIYFSEKEKNSANVGARAIIVYNNEPGIFLGDLKNKLEGPDYKPRIPAVSMSREDGLHLRSMLQNKTVGTLNAFYHPDFVSFFSSRGPVSPFYIKPDLVAPGVFVNTTSILGGYNLTSGTSFAAPHVSGAAAILLQKNKNLTPQEVASIISTTADPISDTFGTRFTQETSGVGRLNITKAFNANTIILPHFAIFNLSPFAKTQNAIFEIKTIDGTTPHIQVKTDLEQNVASFAYRAVGSKLYLNATLVDHVIGQYEGYLIISDGMMDYHVPVLLRVTDGSIDIKEENGRLDFAINSQRDWSYAKITVFNTDSRLVDSVSITPQKSTPVFIRSAGTYWVQAELREGQDTVSLYNTVVVDSPHTSQSVDIGLPMQQLMLIFAVGVIVVAAGLIIRR
ncbi:MAG TPA: S8 family serine peptidase [Candidatus Nitrosotenuis sp.]|nr:S8 family serine peptidase [Candidatus Nitrosotenuis sp.]